MTKIRKPAVAGKFYPEEKQELYKIVSHLLEEATDLASYPKALIVPHAGYIYSGSVAASAYKPLIKLKDKIKKIILLGPSHHIAFRGMALPKAQYFETPLGLLEIDQETIESIKDLPQVIFSDEAHEHEHSLEVHLPFLQKIFDNDFKLTPIVVGDASAPETGEVIEKLWQDEETLIVISTDLSHYHDYLTAYQLDIKTCYDIEDLQLDKLEPQRLCGSMPVKGILHVAQKRGLKVKMVDFCNSGDSQYQDYISTSENNSNSTIKKLSQKNIATTKEFLEKTGNKAVVGYGSYYVGTQDNLGYLLSKPQKLELIRIAYETIHYGVENKKYPEQISTIFRFDQNSKIATFVTLEINGNLRGCIGSLEAHRNIIEDVANNAFAAAFSDPRFPKVGEKELEELEIHISILSKPQELQFDSEEDLLNKIRPQIDGLILSEEGGYRGTFLPSVWEELTDPKEFLKHLKMKAGLPEDYWSDTIKIERYITEVIDVK